MNRFRWILIIGCVFPLFFSASPISVPEEVEVDTEIEEVGDSEGKVTDLTKKDSGDGEPQPENEKSGKAKEHEDEHEVENAVQIPTTDTAEEKKEVKPVSTEVSETEKKEPVKQAGGKGILDRLGRSELADNPPPISSLILPPVGAVEKNENLGPVSDDENLEGAPPLDLPPGEVAQDSKAGDGPGRLEAVIFNADGQGVSGAIVIFPNLGGFKLKTDAKGAFSVSGLPAEGVSMTILKPAYQTKEEVVQVKPEGVTRARISLDLKPVELADGEYDLESREVVLEYEEEDFGGITLADTAQGTSVVSGLGKELLSKSGASDAADAVGKISGANVVGGKFVVVRGLGDRYNNTTLNGGIVPSPETARKAVQLDLFPSDALESVAIRKTGAPDTPADFVGGLVALQTLRNREEDFFSVQISSGYHALTHENGEFFTVPGLELNTFLEPDSPVISGDALLDSAAFSTPTGPQAQAARQRFFDEVKFRPERISPELDRGLSIGFAKNYTLSEDGQNKLSLLGSFNYDSTQRFQRRERSNYRSRITTDSSNRDRLNPRFVNFDTLNETPNGALEFAGLDGNYTQDNYTTSEQWGLLLSANLELSPAHQFNATFFKFRSGESTFSRVDNGLTQASDLDLTDDSLAIDEIIIVGRNDSFRAESFRQAYELKYRDLQFANFGGQHEFENLRPGAKLNWNFYQAATLEESPRSYELRGAVLNRIGADPSEEAISLPNLGNLRNPVSSDFIEYTTRDDSTEFKVDGVFPLIAESDLSKANLIFGLGAYQRSRDSSLTSANITAGRGINQADEAFEATDRLLNDEEVGTDLNPARFEGFVPSAAGTLATPNYFGETNLSSQYVGLDAKWDAWSLSAGVRLEQETRSFDVPGDAFPSFSETSSDLYPSLNLGYRFGSKDQFITVFSYSETVVRPTFYEFIPARIINLTDQSIVTGNRDIRETQAQNFDLRLAWEDEADYVALNLFYKQLTDPIFTVDDPLRDDSARTFANLGDTEVQGLEFEASKNLGGGFSVTGNLSYIQADATPGFVPLGSSVFEAQIDRLEGQPTWLGNLILSYENADYGISANLIYNYTGEFLTAASLRRVGDPDAGIPNEIRQPFQTLDFNISKSWKTEWADMKLKLSASNLLDSNVEVLFEDSPTLAPASADSSGRSFGISFEAKF